MRRLLPFVLLIGCGGSTRTAPALAPSAPSLVPAASPAPAARPDLAPAPGPAVSGQTLHYEDAHFTADVEGPSAVVVGAHATLRITLHPKTGEIVVDPGAPNRVELTAADVVFDQQRLRPSDAVKLDTAELVFETGFVVKATGSKRFTAEVHSAVCTPDVCYAGKGTLTWSVNVTAAP